MQALVWAGAYLYSRRHVDRVGCGPGGGERGPRLGQVAERVVHLALQQLNLNQSKDNTNKLCGRIGFLYEI